MSVKIQPVDAADNFGLFLHDFRFAVRSFPVAQEFSVCHGHFTARHILTHAPSNVLTDRAGFFLCDGTHNRNHEFALAVEGIDVFFLKKHLNAFGFQLTDSYEGIHRVAGKAGDGFR